MLTRKPNRRRRQGLGIGRGESQSLTGYFIESLTAGVSGFSVRDGGIPGQEALLMRMGDPDVDALQNEYAGDESPGATTPTPDQNLIDEIGRAYGVQEADGGGLRTCCELLDRRDGGRSGLPKARARGGL